MSSGGRKRPRAGRGAVLGLGVALVAGLLQWGALPTAAAGPQRRRAGRAAGGLGERYDERRRRCFRGLRGGGHGGSETIRQERRGGLAAR